MSTPAEQEAVAAVAGSALHFVTEPHIFPLFVSFMTRHNDGAIIPPGLIREAVARCHDHIAPDCPEPIERL
jgi:hypothetical protein